MAATTTVRTLPELPSTSRYELLFKLASGGMASVYVGRLRGAGGFWRLVALKKAHAHLMEDPSFRRMLVEEARLASRIHHPNVVAVLDVEQVDDHLLLVLDYIEGASLADILAVKGRPLPPRLAVRIALDACAGLRAAHELTNAAGKPLHIVHRDVSPQNLLVGIDGVSRLTDFGIAKSAQHASTTTTGALKGKLAYMAPEYVDGEQPDQRSDVFGLGVVIWEALANRRLFRGDTEVDTLKRIVHAEAPLLSTIAPALGTELDPVLSAALAKDPNERFASAKALATALEIAARRSDLIGSSEEVGAFVRSLFEGPLSERRKLIQDRVATDVGPQSGRPTVPMPQPQRDGVATDDPARPATDREAPALAAPPAAALAAPSATDFAAPRGPALAAPPAADLAALAGREPSMPAPAADVSSSVAGRTPDPRVHTIGEAAATPAVTTTSPGGDEPSRSSSTLDGSGLSRSGAEPPLSAIPLRPRRTAWIVGAVAALAVGAVVAIGVGRWTNSATADIQAPSAGDTAHLPTGASTSLGSSGNTANGASAASDAAPSAVAAPPLANAPSTAAPTSLASAPSTPGGASSPAAIATSSTAAMAKPPGAVPATSAKRPLPRPALTSSAAAGVLPNPYGAK